MRVKYNDGGRAAAGFRGDAGDCVVRAVAIATGKPYREVYDDLNALATTERIGKYQRGRSSARNGVHRKTIRRYLEGLGWTWTPTMQIGSGCKVHLRAEELPSGRLIVSVSKHLVAVLDGVIHDTHDPAREGARCVYGYWRPCRPINAVPPGITNGSASYATLGELLGRAWARLFGLK
jgi:hypothetical protein